MTKLKIDDINETYLEHYSLVGQLHRALYCFKYGTYEVKRKAFWLADEICRQLNCFAVYKTLHDSFDEPMDNDWYTTSKVCAASRRLEIDKDLRIAKNGTNRDLLFINFFASAELLFEEGEFQAATKEFSKARENASLSHLASASIYGGRAAIMNFNYNELHTLATKLFTNKVEPACAAAMMGLFHLTSSNFSAALQSFLQIPLADLKNSKYPFFGDFLTPSDIARLSVVCAVATQTQEEIKKVYQNKIRKDYLDDVSRNILESYVHLCDYRKCMTLIHSLTAELRANPFVPHDSLLNQVESHAYVEFLSSFSRVSLSFVAHHLCAPSVKAARRRIEELVLSDKLDMKIDCAKEEVIAIEKDRRQDVIQNALQLAKKNHREFQMCLLKMEAIRRNVIVGGRKGK